MRVSVKVYEYVGDGWVEIYDLPRASRKGDCPLWKNGKAPKTMAVSDSAVEAAIQSILGSKE